MEIAYIDNRNNFRKKIINTYVEVPKKLWRYYMHGFDVFGSNNCCLWLLIILLIICLCKSGCLNGFFNSCYCLPVALLVLCCWCKGKGDSFGNLGCGCK